MALRPGTRRPRRRRGDRRRDTAARTPSRHAPGGLRRLSPPTELTMKRIVHTTLAALAAATAIAPAALAGGEPKNESPFTRPAHTLRVAQQLAAVGHVSVAQRMRGEAKNQPPFTRALQ